MHGDAQTAALGQLAAAVQRHGGAIVALNREGGGLEVRIDLPVKAET